MKNKPDGLFFNRQFCVGAPQNCCDRSEKIACAIFSRGRSKGRSDMEVKMKRVKAACICQTLHFMLKEDISHEDAVRFVTEEVAHYKKSLERNRTRYKIVEETTQPDGSIMIRIKKQYNQSPVGDYLNE